MLRALLCFFWRSVNSVLGLFTFVTALAALILAVDDTGALPSAASKIVERWTPEALTLPWLLLLTCLLFVAGSAHAWVRLWRDHQVLAADDLEGDAIPTEVECYLLTDTRWGFGRLFDDDRIRMFTEAMHDATSNEHLWLWGRRVGHSSHTRPMARIPANHIREHVLEIMGGIGGPDALVEHHGGNTHSDLRLNWSQVRRRWPPLPLPVRVFRRLQWRLFAVDRRSSKWARWTAGTALWLRLIPADWNAWKKTSRDKEVE